MDQYKWPKSTSNKINCMNLEELILKVKCSYVLMYNI